LPTTPVALIFVFVALTWICELATGTPTVAAVGIRVNW